MAKEVHASMTAMGQPGRLDEHLREPTVTVAVEVTPVG
jgi:hypothetical protein